MMGIHKMEVYHIGPAIKANLNRIQGLQECKGALLTGLPTGFAGLDRITSGLNKGDLIILASCPYMGKTAFALNVARNLGVENDTPVLIFSLIDTREQLSMRMLSAESRVESHRIRAGELDNEDWERLKKAGERLSKAFIYIDDSPGISVPDMEIMVGDLTESRGICLVIIDYLQLIKGDPGSPNRRIELVQMAEDLRRLAKNLNIPIILIYQLNIDMERRSDKRPNLIDLAEAGSLDQEADMVLFIYRDAGCYPCQDNCSRGRAEIIIAKNRRGPKGMAALRFIHRCSLFTDIEPRARAKLVDSPLIK
jgi:replicative DNA helicase